VLDQIVKALAFVGRAGKDDVVGHALFEFLAPGLIPPPLGG
jgi:hypothetical protein